MALVEGTIISLIEIGSRAIRLLICEVTNSPSYKILRRDYELNNLFFLNNEKDNSSFLLKTSSIIDKYLNISNKFNSDYTIVFGTESVRLLSSENKVKLQNSIPDLKVLTPKLEALCSFWAGINAVPLNITNNSNSLVIDQGSGSMEYAFGFLNSSLKDFESGSYKTGTFFLLQILKKYNYDFIQFGDKISTHLKSKKITLMKEIQNVILLGSAATKLAFIKNRGNNDEKYSPDKVNGTELNLDDFNKYISVAKHDPDLIRSLVNKNENDEEFNIVTCGLIVLQNILSEIKAKNIFVSGFGTRHGLLHLIINEDDKIKRFLL